ncbi:MAG: glycine cleavage system protein H [Syntrophorhabdaceae bacterium]|nr:glycine cleavage system protein H [Syntrophorhabdaceae bacterium]
MSDKFIEVVYDKFVFKADSECLYHKDECWVRREQKGVVVGITDFLQKTSGDVAFVELPEVGSHLSQKDAAGIMETIKTTVTLLSPVSGDVTEINSSLYNEPQLLNSDPFGAGWLFRMVPDYWETESAGLMNAEAYVPVMKQKIDQELSKK